jgi:hypothetical protein
VAWYERELSKREGALQDSQVALADAAGVDSDQDLPWTGDGLSRFSTATSPFCSFMTTDFIAQPPLSAKERSQS